MEQKKQPQTILAIFGITGDLSHRYLLPALAEIKKAGQLPQDFKLLGISRRDILAKEIFDDKTSTLKENSEFFKMDMASQEDYSRLKQKLEQLSSSKTTKPQIIFYFAVPPAAVLQIIRMLGKEGLNAKNIKLLLEKPFGVDLESAAALIEQTSQHFVEDQQYRIDHYMAKEMAQNIAVFLGSNVLFRDVWNKDFIEYIEIVVAEAIGIEGRANFYEQTGALRDIMQSHLLQLAALVLMEPCPDLFDFADLPQRRLAALKSLQAPAPDKFTKQVFRGQYESYRKEVDNPKSTVETFAALQLNSKEERWQGVPVYLATGKNLDQRLTQIRVNFKKSSATEANMLVIRIQPHEGIELDLWVKQPGYDKKLQKKTLSFSFDQNYDRLPDAYEQVLVDAIRGDHSLFASSQEVLESWRILQPVQSHWAMDGSDLHFYKKGANIEEILSTK